MPTHADALRDLRRALRAAVMAAIAAGLGGQAYAIAGGEGVMWAAGAMALVAFIHVAGNDENDGETK